MNTASAKSIHAPRFAEALSLSLAILAVLLIGIISYSDVAQVQNDRNQLRATRTILAETDGLLLALEDEESAHRGFLLTGKTEYLNASLQSVVAVRKHIDILRRVLTDRSEQQEQLDKLKTLVDAKVAEMAEVIEARQTQGAPTALAIVMSDRGKLLMDEIRKSVNDMDAVSERRIATITAVAQARSDRTRFVSVGGSVVLLILFVTATVVINRATNRRIELTRTIQEKESEASRSRDLLRTTLASIDDGVIATDASGTVTFLNRAAEQLTGWTTQLATGKAAQEVFSLVDEASSEVAESPLAKALSTDKIARLAAHTLLITKDGRRLAIDDSAAPIRDESGKTAGAVLVFRDISERRSAEKALEDSERRFRAVFAQAPIGMILTNLDGDYIDSNQAYRELTGYSLEEAPKVRFLSLTHPEEDAENRALLKKLLAGEINSYVLEKRIFRKTGELVWVRSSGTLMQVGEGRADRIVGLVENIDVRKKAEEALLRQWHRFDVALSNTPDFTYTFDLDGRFTYINRALLSLWEKSLDESVGKNFFDLGYPPDLAGRLQRQIQEVIDSKQPIRDQTAFTGAAGTTGYYDYIFVPVFGANGGVEAVAGSTRDITEAKRSEEELRKSEERLSFALAAGGGVGAWDWNVAENRVYCNARFAEFFSIDPKAAAAGVPLSSFVDGIHPDDRPVVEKRISEALASGEDFAEEYRVLSRSGSVRWVYTRGRCHHDADGNPIRFPGVAFDVTERKKIEKDLRDSETRLRFIAESIPPMVWTATPDGAIDYVNRRGTEYFGVPEHLLRGAGWLSFVHPDDVEVTVERWKRSIGTGEPYEISFRLRRSSDQSWRWHLVRALAFVEEGAVMQWFGTCTDIEDQKVAEAELMRANRELEEFTYVASHDLQEPLRMVNVYTQLLLQRFVGEQPDAKTFAGFVNTGVLRMERLIQDLLTFSRTVHREERPLGEADLAMAFTEALAVLKDRIDENAAVITSSRLPLVRGETSQLAHVFQNVLSNALKYRKKDLSPEIKISATKQNNDWLISIRDNGIGFDPQYALRIFGLFKRLHKDEYPGTGLGLAICQRIVERHGGRMWAESEIGQGSTFYIALPSAET